MRSNKNNLVLISVLLIAIAIAYPLTQNENVVSPEEIMVGEQASALLAQIESVRLDPSILINKYFLSLYDRTLPSLDLPKGKTNPFAPGF